MLESFLKKLKIELPHEPAIVLLGIYPKREKENINLKRYMHPNVHSALSTTARYGSNLNVQRRKNG